MLGLLREQISYLFFKQRLKKKLSALYAMEDPWRSADLRASLKPFIQDALWLRAQSAAEAPVLDAGGGEGWFRDVLASCEKYHLVDLSPQALQRAQSRLGDKITLSTLTSLDRFRPAKNTYGAILLISVLTYLGRSRHPGIYQQILNQLGRSLLPGGVILLAHPYYRPEEKATLVSLGEALLKIPGIEKKQTLELSGSQQSFLCETYQKI